jgi:glycosyltransferase involved in cell wall biosynthesis
MRVLAHIHTFNDADIIDRTIEAVLRQTRRLDGILVVDNASTDGTLERPWLQHAAVLRHPENLGTSGAVHSGFRFALEQGYDWIWVFDADSAPEPDALEKLLDLYASWPQNLQDETAFLACLYSNVQDGVLRHGGLFTGSPPRRGQSRRCAIILSRNSGLDVCAASGNPPDWPANPDYQPTTGWGPSMGTA